MVLGVTPRVHRRRKHAGTQDNQPVHKVSEIMGQVAPSGLWLVLKSDLRQTDDTELQEHATSAAANATYVILEFGASEIHLYG